MKDEAAAASRARRALVERMVSEPGDAGRQLTHAALLMACEEYSSLQPEPYLARLQEMAERFGRRCPHPSAASAAAVVGHLNAVLFEEEGLAANLDDYYDPRNSFLNEVLDRKRGIPITLSLLYLDVGLRCGLVMQGVGLPGHFVVRLDHGGSSLFVDPFRGGRTFRPHECRRELERMFGRQDWSDGFADPWPPRQIMVRMLNNLKAIYLRQTDFDRALWVQELLVLLRPEEPRELRDRGLVHAQLTHYGAARHDLRAYLERSVGRPDDADQIEHDLERLRRFHLMLN